MEFSHRHENGVDVFLASGRVDVSGVAEFQDNLLSAIDAGARKIVIDLSAVQYISSSGLRVFALALNRLEPLGGELVISGASGHVRHVLQIVGFESLFRTYPEIRRAVAGFGHSS